MVWLLWTHERAGTEADSGASLPGPCRLQAPGRAPSGTPRIPSIAHVWYGNATRRTNQQAPGTAQSRRLYSPAVCRPRLTYCSVPLTTETA
jgi:hypothetical protein